MKYGPEITAEIAGHLKMGLNRTDSCMMANISYETFTVWMQKSEFSEAVKRAETEFKQRNIALIQRAAITSWQAAAWLLERKYQDEYALKTRLEGVMQVENRPFHGWSPDVLREIVSRASKALAPNGNGGNGASKN